MDQPVDEKTTTTTTPAAVPEDPAPEKPVPEEPAPLEGADAFEIPLQSSDGQIMYITALATRQSVTLSNIIEECGTITQLEERQEKRAQRLSRGNRSTCLLYGRWRIAGR